MEITMKGKYLGLLVAGGIALFSSGTALAKPPVPEETVRRSHCVSVDSDYLIQDRDNLTKIVQEHWPFGNTQKLIDAVVEYNHIKDRDAIVSGETIVLPDSTCRCYSPRTENPRI